MPKQHLTQSLHRRIITVMFTMLTLSLLVAQDASAALRACRADPIVWLSNGEAVQMTTEIGTDASDVRKITYTLHAPVGTEVTKIVYTGGALQSKEQVVFVADMPAHHYSTDTVVTTRSRGINATATTGTSGTFRGSVSGFSGEHLILDFNMAQ